MAGWVIAVACGVLVTGAVPSHGRDAGSGKDTQYVTDIRSGRNTIDDGYLLEWSVRTARPWGSDTSWWWDAAETPRGLAGYVRSDISPSPGPWTFVISLPEDGKRYTVSLPADSSSGGAVIKFDRNTYESTGQYTLEWLIPLKNDRHPSRPVKVLLEAWGEEGKRLPPLQLSCCGPDKNRTGTRGLAVKGVLVVILAVIYILTRKRIRRQMERKESPRRSA